MLENHRKIKHNHLSLYLSTGISSDYTLFNKYGISLDFILNYCLYKVASGFKNAGILSFEIRTGIFIQ